MKAKNNPAAVMSRGRTIHDGNSGTEGCGEVVDVAIGVGVGATVGEGGIYGVGEGEAVSVGVGEKVGLGEGVGVGVGVGVAVGVGDGEGVTVGDGEGDATGTKRFPIGIMNKGIIVGVKLRTLRSVWAPLPFHASNPLATKLAVRFTAEASSRICWATHPASTRANSCNKAPPSPVLPAELRATRKIAGASAAHIWLPQALAMSLLLSPD